MPFTLDLILMEGLLVFAAFIFFAFTYQRFRYRRRKKAGKGQWGFYPSSASLGTALQQLSVLAQPQIEHVLEEKQNEDAEEDSESGPEDPVAHLHWQARKIRRGEKTDRLTAKVKRRTGL